MSAELISHTSPQERHEHIAGERYPRIVMIPRPVVVSSHLALLFVIGIALIQGAGSFLSGIGNPWWQIQAVLPKIAFICAAGALLLVMVNIIEKKWQAPAEYARKFAHVGAGVISLSLPALFSSHWPVLIITVIFSGALLLSRRSNWLTCLHSDGRRGKSDILFLWAVYLVFLLTEGDRLLFQVPVLVLTVGDAAAALIGQRYGRIRYQVSENIRSLEGSIGFTASTFACLLLFFVSQTGMALAQSASLSALVATFASAVEALTPKSLDNLTIPVVTSLLLQTVLS